MRDRSWAELAGTNDKEFPSGTELVESKGTDFKYSQLPLTSSGERPKGDKKLWRKKKKIHLHKK